MRSHGVPAELNPARIVKCGVFDWVVVELEPAVAEEAS
ncbi:hypothetical protein MEA186_01066 [Mesorhizobium amorphae CCNWGS0123]|uniref:Uncharacterized protein n=2 Tax=Mesorhizobium TaxID=68287 RepID=G6Y2S2_9HYPH|nr:hypothetical protein MEA186_01066 [Mesorhizobium amorphae CCNWGS0123]